MWRWITDGYHRLVDATPGGALGLLIVIVALVVVAALVVRRSRIYRGTQGRDPELEIPRERTPEQLRAEADAFAASAEWALAVRARLRAAVLTLEQRGELDARPGRTASEIAAEASRVRPELSDPLWRGVLTFGEIWYGGRQATQADDEVLRTLDHAVRTRGRRPVGAGAGLAPPVAPA